MFVRLGKSHANAIHHLLRNQLLEVNYSGTWQDIHRAFELGRIEGRRLKFTAHERELLRQEARREFGWDLIEPLPDGDRIQAAAHARNEKLAAQRPSAGFVLVKGNLPSGLPSLPAGCSLRLPIEQLDLASLRCVLVVENQDCFDQLHRFALPELVGQALQVYRGHDAIAEGVRHLLQALPAMPIMVFPDYDPAGLEIAATLPRATHLLVPELTGALLEKGSREDFLNQHRATTYLNRTELGGWAGVWQDMQATGVSIKQQHMLAFGAPLRCIAR